MRFGICYNVDYRPEVHGTPRAYYEMILGQCELLEELGFDSAWFSEHHSGPYSFGNPALMIAAAAMRTRRLMLGTGVSLLPLHHPVVLSEEYAMLDQLSGGRLEYGIGRGYLMHEYPWLNVDADESAARYREAADFITRAWSADGPISFEGQFFKVDGYDPFPGVVQQPLPRIYSSAISPDSFTFAGSRNLDLGVALFAPNIHQSLPANLAAYKAALGDAGYSSANREVMGITQMFCARDGGAAVERGARHVQAYFRFFADIIIRHHGDVARAEAMANADPVRLNDLNQTLFGTPADLVSKIRRMRDDWGIDYLQLEVAQGGCAAGDVEDVLRLFAQEVIPHFK